MRERKQSTSTYHILIYMVLSIDHITPATGKTVTVTLSKNAAAFGAVTGAVTEISSGWYKLAGNTTDSDTLGSLGIRATATGCDEFADEYTIVAFDPFDSVRQGMTSLPNAAAEAAGGMYTRGTGAGQINQPANGMIDGNVVRWLGNAVAAAVNGIPKVDLTYILGTILTEGAGGRLAAAFIKWFNVASPTGTTNSLADAIPGATGGLPAVDSTGAAKADVTKWTGTAVASPDAAGYPKTTVKSGTGTGELSLSSGVIAADVTKINGSAARAALFAELVGSGVKGTASGVPTTTTMPASDLTSTHDDQYLSPEPRVIVWTSGVLAGVLSLITDYDNATKTLTFEAVHTAPSVSDTFVIL